VADTSKSLSNTTLRQLRVFAAVARQLSFTAAARELHLTQPAVSMQVKELEGSAGLALFEKIGRRVQLTQAGSELAVCAAQIEEQLQQARERLDGLRGLKRGLLKLGAVSTAKYFAPSLLSAFRHEYPDVTIRFAVGNREEMVRQLAANDIDLVIMGRPPAELETVAESFARHPLIIIAAPSHPLCAKRRIPIKKLEGENFLIRELGSGTRAAMERMFEDKGLTYRASMQMSSNETIKQAVMAGMGISFISAHTVGLELATKRLVALDVIGSPIMRDWFVLYLESKHLAPIASAFRTSLLANGAGIIDAAVGAAARFSRPRRR
jgi:DNA-binding transcriptional LysR family regulator